MFASGRQWTSQRLHLLILGIHIWEPNKSLFLCNQLFTDFDPWNITFRLEYEWVTIPIFQPHSWTDALMISQRFIPSFAAYAWLADYFYRNSCVCLSLKIGSFFWRDCYFTTLFSFYQSHHIELLDQIHKTLVSISSYAFYIKSSWVFTTVVEAVVLVKVNDWNCLSKSLCLNFCSNNISETQVRYFYSQPVQIL